MSSITSSIGDTWVDLLKEEEAAASGESDESIHGRLHTRCALAVRHLVNADLEPDCKLSCDALLVVLDSRSRTIVGEASRAWNRAQPLRTFSITMTAWCTRQI
jgi:hypothetical protein